MGAVWGRAARLGLPAARAAAVPTSGGGRRLGWLCGAGASPLLPLLAALPRGPARPPHFLRAGAGRASWGRRAETGPATGSGSSAAAAHLPGEQPAAMPAAEPEHSPAEPQAPAAAEPVRRGRRRKVKVGAPRAAAGAAILYGLGGLEGGWGGQGEEGAPSLRVTAAFPQQEETPGKKVKQQVKAKRRGKAEAEQAQPEESELGDGDFEPPVPKKTKKAKEKRNGLVGESDASQQAVKSAAAVSGSVTSPAAREQDSDAEVGMLFQQSLCLG